MGPAHPDSAIGYLGDRYPAAPEIGGRASTPDGPPAGRPGPDAPALPGRGSPLGEPPRRSPVLAVVGRVAAQVAASSELGEAIREAGIEEWTALPLAGLDDLGEQPGWDLAVILSPYKAPAAALCNDLSPSAAATGAVDTLVRRGPRIQGLNTNTFGVEAVLHAHTLLGADRAALVVGTGAAACSVLLGIRRASPEQVVLVAGRDPASTRGVAERFEVEEWAGRARAVAVIVHATTWGETAASEKEALHPDVLPLLGPGRALLDLNSRVSSLQNAAARLGAAVVGGREVQRVIHRLRAALLRDAVGSP